MRSALALAESSIRDIVHDMNSVCRAYIPHLPSSSYCCRGRGCCCAIWQREAKSRGAITCKVKAGPGGWTCL